MHAQNELHKLKMFELLAAKHERLRRRNNRLFLYPSLALLVIAVVGKIILSLVY